MGIFTTISKRFLGFLAMTTLASAFIDADAAAPAWSVNPHDFRYDMSLYAEFSVNQTALDYADYTLAAFVDSECRGVGEVLETEAMESPVVYMRIYSNTADGETVSFKGYNSKTDQIVEFSTTLSFKSNEQSGAPSTPQIINYNVPVEAVNITPSSQTVLLGESFTFIGSVSPENAFDKSLSWSSSDPTVATVENGIVTSLKMGETIISCESSNGLKASASLKINPVECSSITLDKTEYTGREGTTLQLTATIAPENTTDKTISWTTSNENVATVNNGLVSLIGMGTATITAICGNQSAICNVTVTAPLPTSISLSPSTVELNPGQTQQLIVAFTPSNAEDAITWTTSDANIATVENGIVKAIAEGNAVITVTTAAGLNASSSIIVKAEVVEVSSIIISPEEAELEVGASITLIATIAPENATDKTLEWSSSDEKIATVENGVVKAVAAGTAIITVSSTNGVKATAEITVKEGVVEVSSITVSPDKAELEVGTSITLIATITPENATDKTLTWSSSDEKIATVENGVVKAVAAGTAIITVSSANGVKATAEITVKEGVVEVSSITVSPDKAELEVGASITLIATITPENATDKTLTWSSSDAKIATVNNGVVKAGAAGTATITVSSTNGVNATAIITVKEPKPEVIEVQEVTVTPHQLDLTVGTAFELSVEIYPENATDQTIAWSSSDSNIATVEDGLVTALSAGEVTVTAVSVNGVKGFCVVKCIDESGVEFLFAEDEKITVYDLNGNLIKANAEKSVLSTLQKGIYIIKSGNKIVKHIR